MALKIIFNYNNYRAKVKQFEVVFCYNAPTAAKIKYEKQFPSLTSLSTLDGYLDSIQIEECIALNKDFLTEIKTRNKIKLIISIIAILNLGTIYKDSS